MLIDYIIFSNTEYRIEFQNKIVLLICIADIVYVYVFISKQNFISVYY